MKALTKKDIDQMKELLLDGLVYDGGHHKQYYLEQVLQIITTKKEFTEFQKEYHWEEGIPA